MGRRGRRRRRFFAGALAWAGGSLARFGLAVLLLWAGTAALLALAEGIGRAGFGREAPWPFLGGLLLYLPFHALVYRPVLSHVLAHELSHALAAVLLGGKVSAIHATQTGGSAVVTSSHWFVSLAPYVLPFYTVLLLPVYGIADADFRPVLAALLGFTYGFHLTLTAASLRHPQPDLKTAGAPFSLIFIGAGNIMTAMLLLTVVWPEALPLLPTLKSAARWAAEILGFLFSILSLPGRSET